MRSLVPAAVAFVLLAAPADAAVTWDDPCGDVDTVVRAVGTDVVDATTPRTARHDVRRTSIEGVRGGADVRLRVCGAIPAPERITSAWQVTVRLEDGCSVSAFLGDAPGTGDRRARLFSFCTRGLSTPLGGAGSETYEVWDVALPASAWSVAGDTITWRLRGDALGDEQAARLAPGTRWSDPRTHTWDGARVTEASLDDLVAVNGPGARDQSATDASLVLE